MATRSNHRLVVGAFKYGHNYVQLLHSVNDQRGANAMGCKDGILVYFITRGLRGGLLFLLS
jgi:hypothetical protein